MMVIRMLKDDDVLPIAQAFAAIGWRKPASQYRSYLVEQAKGLRLVLTAFQNGVFAGYLTVLGRSEYHPFAANDIPEISDFNVLPEFRRIGIGTRLMDEAERLVADRSTVVGLGVGLSSDYGAAQRLYVLSGYVPDGRGIWQGSYPKFGDLVTVDDDLALYLTKQLKK